MAVVSGAVAALAWPALGRAEPVAEATPPPEATAPVPAARASRVPAEQPAAHRRRFYVDFGGALVKPVSSSRELELADVEGPASLAVQNGPIKGSGATVGSALIPAGSIGWVLPWWKSRRVSAELVFGLPFKVTFEATGTLANMSIAPTALGIPTGVPALGPRLGEAMATPVVVTTVYQLIDHGVLRPYLGAGASVLFASQAKVTNPTLTEVSRPEMSISPAPGLVLQGGLEARLSDRIFARFDVKFIALMLARAQVHHIEVNTPDIPLFGNVEVGTAKMDVWVNPLIVHAGIGFDFDL
ncbi:MAG TPA: OmpW family outer membrane protein [Kofleriaceae bacterium]|nr:OmpW family outer membrane protein [Kofleriaceae bacterium]